MKKTYIAVFALFIATRAYAETNSGDITESSGSPSYVSASVVGSCANSSDMLLNSAGLTRCDDSSFTLGTASTPAQITVAQTSVTLASSLVCNGGVDLNGQNIILDADATSSMLVTNDQTAFDMNGGTDELTISTSAVTTAVNAIFTTTADFRGVISNSTGDITLTDNITVGGVMTMGGNYLLGMSYRGVAITGASTAMSPTFNNYVFTNTGASAEVEFTLPDAVAVNANEHHYFWVTDTDGIEIQATNSNVIYAGTTTSIANGCITSTTKGSFAWCMATEIDVWMCNVSGTWTVDSGC